jgi:diguanylate cyclase (GGDEF)-like protein
MKRLLQRFLPLPISLFLIGFFSISLLFFALIGGWMLLQMEKVTGAAETTRQQAADYEVQNALEGVLHASQQLGEELAQWDELLQQLHDDTYYEYWRNARALQTTRTPHFVSDLDLYDREGKVLQSRSTSALPAQLPGMRGFVRIVEGTPYLFQFNEVKEKGGSGALLGYLGVRIDLGQALRELNRFIHADSRSIEFNLPAGTSIPADAIPLHLHYAPLGQGETGELEAVMRHTLYGFAALAVVLIIISYFLTSSLLHAPLRNLAQYIEDLRRGRGDIGKTRLRGSLCVREFDVLRSSIINYQHELEEMHSHLDQKNRELWRLAHHDALTGVANRRAYDEDWMRLQELVHGQRISVSVMLIDCDHFKAINDTYGHDVGDRVIRVVADSLRSCLREGDHLYRLGGDEFAVHLLNTSNSQSRALAERFQDRLVQFDFRELGIREPIRFSIGIATATGQQPHELSQLHKQADIAMYQAKRPGSNKIIIYNEGMASNGEALLSNRYITAVYRAIEHGSGIELHFQPVVSTEAGARGFYETLVRLRDERGIIMPINIFPVIESEGLAVEFDYAVFRRIAEELERGTIPGDASISLNVDGSTLMHQDFIRQVSMLNPFICPERRSIVLEITEGALISEIEEGSRKLRHLRETGFTIALDDFGSGYSSLRYLANMPVDIIKLDIGMVRDLEGDTRQRIITEHIAHMVRGAGYQLVAEGIESEALLQRILALGFTHAQGFLFDRPLSRIDPAVQLALGNYRPEHEGRERA